MFILEVESGQVDLNDSKTILFTPRNRKGEPINLSQLVLTLEHPSLAQPVVYQLSEDDFETDGDDLFVSHKFDQVGNWSLHAVGFDILGEEENESDSVYVHP